MLFSGPASIPARIGFLPATWMRYRERLDEVVARHPLIFGAPEENRNYDAVGGTYVTGDHVDAWGCVWSNIQDGLESMVKQHPVPTRADVHALKAPEVDTGFRTGSCTFACATCAGLPR